MIKSSYTHSTVISMTTIATTVEIIEGVTIITTTTIIEITITAIITTTIVMATITTIITVVMIMGQRVVVGMLRGTMTIEMSWGARMHVRLMVEGDESDPGKVLGVLSCSMCIYLDK